MTEPISTLLANYSQIATGVAAVGASLLYWKDRLTKKRCLEKYLKAQKGEGLDQGQRSVLHLTRHLAMTEDDVLHAAFLSKKIEAKVRPNKETGLSEELLLVHK